MKVFSRTQVPGLVVETVGGGMWSLADQQPKHFAMLDCAARHNIAPVNEHYPMSKVNDAFEHLRSGKAPYRIVLDRD